MGESFSRMSGDLAEDARLLLLDLERELPGAAATSNACRPPLDVVETSATVEVLIDVPGVPIDSLRIAVRRNTLLVVGVKPATAAAPDARFHVAERTCGRFARAIHVAGAFDASCARATSSLGQLRVVLPRMADRRGRTLTIPVTPK